MKTDTHFIISFTWIGFSILGTNSFMSMYFLVGGLLFFCIGLLSWYADYISEKRKLKYMEASLDRIMKLSKPKK